MGVTITLAFAFTEGAFETAIEEVPLQKLVSLPAYLKATAKGNHVESQVQPSCKTRPHTLHHQMVFKCHVLSQLSEFAYHVGC